MSMKFSLQVVHHIHRTEQIGDELVSTSDSLFATAEDNGKVRVSVFNIGASCTIEMTAEDAISFAKHMLSMAQYVADAQKEPGA